MEDQEAWHAAVHRVAKSQTQLRRQMHNEVGHLLCAYLSLAYLL